MLMVVIYTQAYANNGAEIYMKKKLGICLLYTKLPINGHLPWGTTLFFEDNVNI